MFWDLNKKGSTNNNIINVISQLLSQLQIQVTQTSIKEAIEEHPDYPSMLCISDSLGLWGIVNKSYKLNKEKLLHLPTPFITNLNSQGGIFITVSAISESSISYFDPFKKNGMITRTIDEFEKDWGEIALIVESANLSKEKNYEIKKQKEALKSLTIPFIVASGCLLLLLLIISSLVLNHTNPFLSGALGIIKFLGCIITSILLWYEIDKSNPFIRQICSANGKTDCSAVLESRGAKIFNWLSWSEIGFFYFAGGFLFLLFETSSNTLSILAWLNLAALPYCFFSIYYQWKVVKQWCPLCLAIQALLLLEFGFLFFLYWSQFSSAGFILTSHLILLFLTAFLLPVLFWSFSKFYFIQAKSGEKYKQELDRLKYNYQFFESLLSRQKKIENITDDLGIILGNLNGSIVITKVCNPYCDPCAKAHVIINELLQANSGLKVQIIFNATNQEGDTRKEPVKHFMSIYKHSDQQQMHQALDDWYLSDIKDYEKFAAKYPISEKPEAQDEQITKMSNWCQKNRIEFTPTLFINGNQLPEIYSPADLKFFLL
ncbi:MAG TPA: vitamin K epoxide reductase family protein [Chitinophagaceae bacterium]|nr:vitamin K epoxide reductase family protein [Chitinophagaceae bacterium]